MFAEILQGERELADVVFLIALICAGIGTVIYVMSRAIPAALVAAAVALVAFGFLAL